MSRQPANGGGGLPGIYSRDFPPQYAKYNTQYEGEKEVLGWSWWDTALFTSATTLNINYFNVARVAATPDVTNMEVNGQLAAPKAFLLRTIKVYVKARPFTTTAAADNAVQTGLFDDIVQLMNTGVLRLTIGNKDYGSWPLWQLLSAGGPWGFMQTGDIDVVMQWGSLGVPDNRVGYTLTKPLFIAPQINFNVNISWPAVITLDSGNQNICVLLDGDLIRPVQ